MLVEIERFVNWVRRRNPGARTWRDYGYDLRFFMEVVGDRPPNEITLQEVDRFVMLQGERGFKATTINRRLAAVMSLYAFLSDKDTDLVCPVLPNCHHLREPERLPRPVQDHDLKQVFAMIESARDRAMFLLMIRCGLRISGDAAVPSIQKHLGHVRLEATQLYIMANDKQVCEDYYAAYQKLESWQFVMEATSSHKGML